MRGGFYIKLAATGIGKNRKLYFPYILTCICMVMMFYIVVFLAKSSEIRNLPGGDSLQTMLGLGVFVIAIFALIFLYYTNSFLIRRRQKEFGLYHILGMGKRSLVKILIWENILTAGVSILLGLICGVLFSRMAELAAAKIVSGEIGFGFAIEPAVTVWTAGLFVLIFFLIMLRMLIHIYRLKPVEMLRSENVGEKPPKANWILAVIGLLILSGAYYLAVTIDDPLTALLLFFVAVVMVIIATYLLFIAGTVALCRLLQKNKKYYYKTKHFVSLSSMVYRMKRNGAGLASICILSTMVLVTVSSTVCLFAGTENSLNRRYPRNITAQIYSMDEENYVEPVRQEIGRILKENGEEAENVLDYRLLQVAAYQAEDTMYFDVEAAEGKGVNVFSNIRNLYIIPLDDYNRTMGTSETLKEDEMILYATKGTYDYDTISLENCGTWKVKEKVSDFTGIGFESANISASYYLFVKDVSVLERIEAGEAEIYGNNMSEAEVYYGFDLDCPKEKQIGIYNEIQSEITAMVGADAGWPNIMIESRAFESAGYYGMTGGLFFLGILLGAVFLFGTVLIMYYKQISEGYEDQNRFDILMKVGMSRREVKQSINSQVLTVFFLPLVMAGIHLLFAFPLITKLLMFLISTNERFLTIVTIGCYIVFVLFYVLVYAVTSREYYKIVSGKKEKEN